MGIKGVRQALTAAAATLALAGAAFLASAPGAQAAHCSTGAQSITDRRGISCRSANRVFGNVSRAARRGGAPLPECRGDFSLTFLGWRVTAAPIGGGMGIGTKFAKGGQSFRVSGGGTC